MCKPRWKIFNLESSNDWRTTSHEHGHPQGNGTPCCREACRGALLRSITSLSRSRGNPMKSCGNIITEQASLAEGTPKTPTYARQGSRNRQPMPILNSQEEMEAVPRCGSETCGRRVLQSQPFPHT
ncbi:hypothetical protein JTB14_026427 [Gonioctena quinquepunctata]|nr:hypothetical protein JTB14_026427 [Gonioctena quinquepunctata]